MPAAPQQEDTRHECHHGHQGDGIHGHHHGHHHGDGHRDHSNNQCSHTQGSGRGHSHGHHGGQGQPHEHAQDSGIPQTADHLEVGQAQQALNFHHLLQHIAAGARPWESKRWKSQFSWQWTEASDTDAFPKASWCWHWRRLFGSVGSERPVGLWHCNEVLPASWQWHGLMGDKVNARETWQWRSPLAVWQQPQPAPWAWPQGVSWGWEQV